MRTPPPQYLKQVPELRRPLTFLKGVGPGRAALFAGRGLHTLLDLLFYLPLRYEDRRVISPIDEAEKVNVPLMLIHGSVDQRVPPEHVRRYMRELDKYNKPYKYVELDGADHFYSTLFYEHQIALYESLKNFLRDDCGPGGLK